MGNMHITEIILTVIHFVSVTLLCTTMSAITKCYDNAVQRTTAKFNNII